MKSFPQEKKERLIELIEQELKMFGRIREISVAQTDLLATDYIESFDKSLDARQEIIEKINGLHQESEVLMQSYISFSNSADSDKINEIESAATRLRDMIALCVELDEKNTSMIEGKKQEHTRQVTEMSMRRESLGKYAPNLPNNPKMFDKMT